MQQMTDDPRDVLAERLVRRGAVLAGLPGHGGVPAVALAEGVRRAGEEMTLDLAGRSRDALAAAVFVLGHDVADGIVEAAAA